MKRLLKDSNDAGSGPTDIGHIIASRPNAWTVKALAEILCRKPAHLYKLIRSGSLPAYKMGGCLLLDPKETSEWWRGLRTL